MYTFLLTFAINDLCLQISFYLKGAHPREPVADLLSITQSHTLSLEDHGRQLTRSLGHMKSKLASSDAMRKLLGGAGAQPVDSSDLTNLKTGDDSSQPTTANEGEDERSDPKKVYDEVAEEAAEDKLEKKFAELKTNLVEKCQSSKDNNA